MKNDILFKKLSSRLDELSKFAKLDDEKSIPSLIKEKGFSRCEFMAWAAAMTSMLMLPAILHHSLLRQLKFQIDYP